MTEDQTGSADAAEPQEQHQPAQDAPKPAQDAPSAAPARRWSTRKTAVTAVGAVIVLAVVGGGGAAIYAAASHDGAGHGAHGRFGPGGPGGWGGPRGRGGPMSGGPLGAAPFRALHGEFTVPDGTGGYTTEQMQIGTVTAVTPTSVTAKSADGFSKTYQITSSTRVGTGNGQITGLGAGDPVAVTAHSDGTAVSVRDLAGASGPGHVGQTN